MERVDEAGAEDVVAGGGDGRVGGRRGEHGDLKSLGDAGALEGAAGGDLADEGDDLVAGDEFFDDGGGFAGFGLGVLDEEFDLFAEDAAGGVDLVDGEAGGLGGGVAEGAVFAGDGGVVADLDGVGGGFGSAGGEEEGGGERGKQGKGAAEKRGHGKKGAGFVPERGFVSRFAFTGATFFNRGVESH